MGSSTRYAGVRNEDGDAPLHEASRKGLLDVVRCLVSKATTEAIISGGKAGGDDNRDGDGVRTDETLDVESDLCR